MTAIIQAHELSCFYGVVLGLNNVSFTIGEGITGIVGPNGAGKSTLIKLITGQIRPSSGSLTVFGQAPWNEPAVLSKLGYCPEHEHVHKDLLPLEWLSSLALLSGLPLKEARRRSEQALEAVRLAPAHWRKPIGTYSKGMRQRVKLAQSLLHAPALILLDEPMNGLDPMGRHEISDILRDLRRRGTHIIISSHILDELESLCSDFLMISWGRALASGSSSAIRAELPDWPEEIVIRTNQPQTVANCLQQAGQLRGYLLGSDQVVLWLKEPGEFYRNWPAYLESCDATIHELRSRGKSLTGVFEEITR